jgi:glycosyltransferase involved in cell wall biosynthesis
LEVDYIYGKKTSQVTGISKYQDEIHKRLPEINLHQIGYQPLDYEIKGFNAGNVTRLYATYPLQVVRKINPDHIQHITTQSLAYLLNFINTEKSLVTCYDLIPWAYDNNRTLPWKLNLRGLKKAQKIITISKYSQEDIVRYVGCSPENIEVVYPAINHNYYYPQDYDLREFLKLPEYTKLILYVGSEEPRQNLELLIRSLAKLKKQISDVKLVKVGEPQHVNGRKIRRMVTDLGLKDDVVFIGAIEEGQIPNFYRGVDVLVYPCLYAGFGLPPLEAMACGTPVITSNVSSLPEVVGEAGIMINPYKPEDLTNHLVKILNDKDLQKDMIMKGLKRSKKFNWETSAQKTREIYRELLG